MAAISKAHHGSGGEDLMPNIVDRIAAETPDKTYALWPVHPFSYEAGFRTLTYADLSNAANGLAWWIDRELGPSEDGEVLTYIGPTDVRYIALLLAAIKTGYGLFLTSPRNSAAAQRALFDALQCRTLLTPDPAPAPAAVIVEAVAPRVLTVPGLDDLLSTTHPFFASKKTYEEARSDPAFIIHTSGSTGLPKPLIWTNETAALHYNLSVSQAPDGVQSVEEFCSGKRVMVTLPAFHGAGITGFLFHPIAINTVPVAPAARGIVTAQGLLEALRQTPAEIGMLVPSVVAELAQDPAVLEACAQYLKLIIYIGGDLPQALGDKVNAVIPLRCQYGASEFGIPQQLLPKELGPNDWRYVRLHPALGVEFQEEADGLHEAVIRRRQDLASTQTSFTIRSQVNLDEYRTRDYFEKHPTVPDAWCWKARADDIIVFLNGEKTNPISMEGQIVSKNKELGNAIVFGSQRFQAGLLIEPADPESIKTTADEAALIERVWPSVEEANRSAPAHAIVEKPFILVAKPDRPIIRTGKGTIQRSATLTKYTEEIDKVYADAEITVLNDEAGEPVDFGDTSAVMSLLRNVIQSTAGWSSLGDDDSFFDRGLDSLQALQITRTVRHALQRPVFAMSTIYKNPNVRDLAAAIVTDSSNRDNNELMASLLSTYSRLVKQIPVPKAPKRREGPVDVLLTGSTGYLGTYMLHSLLNRPNIGHVFCLNRGEDGGRAAQLKRFEKASLPKDAIESRVTFLKADLAHPSLGLDSDTYRNLEERVGLIIHNAWPVNFNLELHAFRPQLAGVVNLCALSAASELGAPLFFISSVAAMSMYTNGAPIPETVSESLTGPYPYGYTQSKFIAEQLCESAADHLQIPIAVARVGQIAGPVERNGLWNTSEWLPSLLKSSIYLGCLPDNLGPQFNTVDWIPSDVLGEVIADIVTTTDQQGGSGAQVFNLRNPNTTNWEELIPTVIETVQEHHGSTLEVVAPSVWLERLQQSMTAAINKGDMRDLALAAEDNPALRLLEFYRDSLWPNSPHSGLMAVDRSVEASRWLKELSAVGPSWMRKWVEEWIVNSK